MNEFFTIPGYRLYKVNKNGEVYSLIKNRLLKPQFNTSGYKTVTLCENGNKNQRTIHTLVLETFVGKRPSNNHDGSHNDGIKTNNHISNLAWKTKAENTNDKIKHGTVLRGEKLPTAKLKESQVIFLRKNYKYFCNGKNKKFSTWWFAKQFNVDISTIKYALTGKTWKHLD